MVREDPVFRQSFSRVTSYLEFCIRRVRDVSPYLYDIIDLSVSDPDSMNGSKRAKDNA